MKRKVWVVVLFCSIVIGVHSFALAKDYPGLEQMKPIEIKFNNFAARTHSMFLALDPYFNGVEKASKGKIKFKVYSGGVLLKAAETLRGISNLTVETGGITTTYFPAYLPRVNLLSDVLLMTDDAAATCATSTELLLNYPQFFDEEFKKNNLYLLGGLYATRPYRILSNTPIRTLSDIEGKKVRAAGALWSRLARKLNAVGVQMPISEAYEALQRGTLDAVFGSVDFLNSYSIWEVAKYVTEIPVGCYCGTCGFSVNRTWWDNLPRVAKQILLENMASIPAGITITAYCDREDKTRALAPSHGVQFIEPADDLKEALDQIKKDEKEEAIQSGIKRGIDKNVSKAIVESYLSTYNKWKEISENRIKDDVKILTNLLDEKVYNKLKEQYAR
jgi:TRAP-type C4-dicarboxylate transport system substrate-binding protein